MRKLKAEIPGENYHRELISCQVACPVHTDARGYIRAIAEQRFDEAYLIARGPNPFASICGRICGAPCETACRRGQVPRVDDDGHFVANDRPVSIRALKGFACSTAGPERRGHDDVLRTVRAASPSVCSGPEEMAALLRAALEGRIQPAKGEQVAIIGAGPAGLSAAHDLALLGFNPVVFESEPVPAGMLALGVPAYRLPPAVIEAEVNVIRALGVDIRCGVTVGKEISFAQLRSDFAAVILAVGAKSSRGLGIPGEHGPRVFGGVDLLRAVALELPIELGKDVVVVGGGNVAYDVARTVLRQIAYDAARTAARLPATSRVRLVSLEGLEEMPATTTEIIEGDEEGIERLNGWGPVGISRDRDGLPTGVIFRKCLRVYDENQRFAPLFDDTERQTLHCDTVLLAVGQTPVVSFLSEGGSDIEMTRPGWLKIDSQTLATTAPGVFVAGDLAHGTRLLIDAVAALALRWALAERLPLEAIASGLPCVGVDAYALPELIHHGENGFIVRPFDPEEMASRALDILGDPARFSSFSAAGLRIAAEHDIVRCALHLEDVYRRQSRAADANKLQAAGAAPLRIRYRMLRKSA